MNPASPLPGAYTALLAHLGLDRGAPFSPGWSAAPDFLQLITGHCLRHAPETILECSSGLTTLVLARCCQRNGRGRVVSLENGREYADETRRWIERYGLSNHAEVVYAPLSPVVLDDVRYDWYATEDIPDDFADMLVIDGPPGFLQKHSRYPALPLLMNRLREGCAVFLDDAARPDEQEIVARWLDLVPGLTVEWPASERGCALLRLPRHCAVDRD